MRCLCSGNRFSGRDDKPAQSMYAPVIPLLFAGFQGQRRHILALLAGMIVMFTLVAMAVTVASEWIAEATIVGRWIALVILARPRWP